MTLFLIIIFAGVALIFAGLILMAIWVYQDAKLREMDTPFLWALVVLLVSNCLGILVYLLIRPKAKTVTCSNCGYKGQIYKYCNKCGTENFEKPEEIKSKYGMLILGFIFLAVSILMAIGGAIGLIAYDGGFSDSSNFYTVGSVEYSSGNKWEMSFKKLNGSKTKTFKSNKDSPKLVYSSEITSGNFRIEILDKDGNLIDTLETNTDGIAALESGIKYKIKISGTDAKGSFSMKIE